VTNNWTTQEHTISDRLQCLKCQKVFRVEAVRGGSRIFNVGAVCERSRSC